MPVVLLPDTPERLTILALRGREAGQFWYRDAELAVRRAAERHGVSAERFAFVLAATSPRVSVSRNWRETEHYFTFGALPPGTLPSHAKAIETGRLGPKTGPFRDAILGDPDAVVLDVWVGRALRVDPAVFSHPASHRVCEEAVRRVAQYHGWTPASTQAMIWAGAYLERWPGGHVPAF